MKDPLDNRLDAYALLNCAENCTRADIQRNYTAQLVRRAAPQRALQTAREMLARTDQRLMVDLYRYNCPQEVLGTEALKPRALDLDICLPLEPLVLSREWIDVVKILSQVTLVWTSPEPPALRPIPREGWVSLPVLPIEFDR